MFHELLQISELVVHPFRPGGVKEIMRSETMGHIPAIRLWQAICGGPELPKHQFSHMMHCEACERLATQIGDALDEIEDALRRHKIGMGAAHAGQHLN